ncbi:hypothetical protein Back2_14250 [Nocardioides baekrokdamisoli]|uniref:Gram-positive cocci surface proteins LPxTG domain-containing protein n=2 Tax=Nocardioides baekrokdamisoli TaxID=1804624 RepID=A0A3G9J0H8_9ACTN|nr:hypothetical protein Back2_14250 [Nocardioides baekrokdamisoli]
MSVIANATLAVAASSAVVLGSSVAGAASVAPAAYQGGITTIIKISVIPRQLQSTCVDVHISVSSDAGTPVGTVNFSIDGHILDTRAVPSSGSFTEAINCGAVGTIGRELHGTTSSDTVQDVAFVSTAATTPGLSVGTHLLKAAYVPTGNWQAASASTSILIYAPTTGGNTGGLPTGVDAGLTTFNQAGAGNGSDLRAAISGAAMALALGVVAVYRRRATR